MAKLKIKQYITAEKEIDVPDDLLAKWKILNSQVDELKAKINADTGKEVSLYAELETLTGLIADLGLDAVVVKQLDAGTEDWLIIE